MSFVFRSEWGHFHGLDRVLAFRLQTFYSFALCNRKASAMISWNFFKGSYNQAHLNLAQISSIFFSSLSSMKTSQGQGEIPDFKDWPIMRCLFIGGRGEEEVKAP